MRALGINRLSIGVQAFQRDLLALLDRDHTPEQAEHAVAMARAAGFRNVSVDLMFALPGQTRAQWDETLTRALDLGTEHVSLYSLTLEPGTRLERLHAGGKIARAGEELDLWMYERAIERLTGAGFEHYEISNFARPGYRCRHNLVYWRNGEYAGFGPGAVSYIDSRRMTTEKRPALYVSKVRGGLDAVVECESLDWRSSLGETMMLGIRLLDGVPLGEVRARYGSEVDSVLAGPIERLEARGLVRCANDTIRLTRRGLLLADTVALEFLA
jgi:oxygen-independent coproporphyrinogen-3 oxidase